MSRVLGLMVVSIKYETKASLVLYIVLKFYVILHQEKRLQKREIVYSILFKKSYRPQVVWFCPKVTRWRCNLFVGVGNFPNYYLPTFVCALFYNIYKMWTQALHLVYIQTFLFLSVLYLNCSIIEATTSSSLWATFCVHNMQYTYIVNTLPTDNIINNFNFQLKFAVALVS